MRFAINGFGRIGRCAFRAVVERGEKDVEIVAINDLDSPATLAHLLKYDSVHGNWKGEVKAESDAIIVDGKRIQMTRDEPGKWQWGKLGVDIVVEATGKFRDRESCQKHLDCGAKKVVISAPGKGVDATVVYNVNHQGYDPAKHHIISNASCTTNCLAPAIKVLHEKFGVKQAVMTTVHAYTTSQAILDSAQPKDPRRGRAAALNFVPTTTGAAKAVSEVLPDLKGKIDGMAIRGPAPDGSLVDLVCLVEKSTSKEEVNATFKAAANETLGYTEEYIVSGDIVGDTHGGVVDGLSTMVNGGTLVKVLVWYDNEQGFNNQLLRTIKYVGSKL